MGTSTRVYAKVDLNALRVVAEINLRGCYETHNYGTAARTASSDSP